MNSWKSIAILASGTVILTSQNLLLSFFGAQNPEISKFSKPRSDFFNSFVQNERVSCSIGIIGYIESIKPCLFSRINGKLLLVGLRVNWFTVRSNWECQKFLN